MLETHCHNGDGGYSQRQHQDDAHDNRENLLGALRRFATFLLLQLALSSSLNLCGLLLGRKLLTHSLIPQLSANLHAALASLGGIDEHFPLIAAHVPLASTLVNWLATDHGEHDVSRSAAFNDRRNGVDKRSLTRTRQIDHRNIGAFAGLEGSNLVFHMQCTGTADRGEFEHGFRPNGG